MDTKKVKDSTFITRTEYRYEIAFLSLLLTILFLFWSHIGFGQTVMFADFGRDLTELSNLWTHRMVWLGPQLHVGFPASPIYYFILLPMLLLSKGSAYSLIVTEALLAAIALGFLAFNIFKKSFFAALAVTLFIGFSSWWMQPSTYPWNGHMYVSFTLLALTSMWFEFPIFLSSLFLGVATAIHPAALLVSPLLAYEILSKKNQIKNICLSILGMLLPWAPIIGFEIITHGYLIRQWLALGYIDISKAFSFNYANVIMLTSFTQISYLGIALGLIISFVVASKKGKYWIILTALTGASLLFIVPLNTYYLYGLILGIIFSICVNIINNKFGIIMLAIISLLYIKIALTTPFTPSYGISEYENVTQQFLKISNLDKSKKYAVVSVIDESNTAPQADAYRFFLRMKGLKVLNIDEYPTADYLIIFVHINKFDWKNWEDYTTRRFGNKKLISTYILNGINIGMYKRQ